MWDPAESEPEQPWKILPQKKKKKKKGYFLSFLKNPEIWK